MKNLLLLGCLLSACTLFSQDNDFKITYKRFEGNLKRDDVLYIKNNEPTVMKTNMASTAQIVVKKDTTYIDANGATVMQSFGADTDYSTYLDEYIKVDQSTNAIEMIRDVHRKNFLVTDQINYSWKITNETKQIQNYTCYKATTSFRGNTFEVWFTPDIPINAGPWKWYGLPGLIVEATDTDQSVVYKLEKIEPLNETIPFPSKNLKRITLKEYFDKGEEALQAMLAKLNADRNGTVTYTRLGRFGLEREYEWEVDNE